MTVQIYVGTYAKYNNGSIAGAWVDLEQFDNEAEFMEHIAELHSDEADPEYMYQDFEGFPEALYSESNIDSRIFEWLALDENERDIVEAYTQCVGSQGDFIQAALDSYRGEARTHKEFAEQFADEVGLLSDVPESLRYYFDFDAYARDLMMDFSEHDGYYFANK